MPRSDTMNARYKNIDNDPRGLWKPGGFSVKTYTKEYDYSITTPTGMIVYPPSGSCWQTSKENYEKKLADNRIYFGKNGDSKPQIKQFLYEVQQGMVSKTIWLYDEVGHNQIAKKEVQILNAADVFATPKPERLIERVLTLGSNPGDLILDSFLGSGTTSAVAQKIGRRYIGIEMGEHAITHAAPRLKKVIDGEQGGISKSVNWQGGGGFTFYDLGEAIFDEKGNINKRIDFKSLAFHIWFSETKTAMREYKKSPLLGVFDNAVYYLLYNGILGDKKVNGGNVLTSKILETLPKPDNRKHKKVIYGEACRLSSDKLRKENITFKQNALRHKSRIKPYLFTFLSRVLPVYHTEGNGVPEVSIMI